MNSLSLLSLSTLSQYALFGGIALVLFGWFEKKERLTYAGQAVFIALGVFALGVLLSGKIDFKPVNGGAIPKELKILSFLKLSVGLAALNVVSISLGLLKHKLYKTVLYLIVTGALCLFFMIFNLLQTPAAQ